MALICFRLKVDFPDKVCQQYAATDPGCKACALEAIHS